jgi:hypothetical protein
MMRNKKRKREKQWRKKNEWLNKEYDYLLRNMLRQRVRGLKERTTNRFDRFHFGFVGAVVRLESFGWLGSYH